MNNKILLNIIFYGLINQSFFLLSTQPPQLPQRARQVTKKNKLDAFERLLAQANDSHSTSSLLTETTNDSQQSKIVESFNPPIPQINIQYYTPLSPQDIQSGANELIITYDKTPQIFLKRYSEETPLIDLNLQQRDIDLLTRIHHDAKRVTSESASFIVKIDNYSYGIQYIRLDGDCRSLGEQIEDITDIKPTENSNYSLIIDHNNIVTLQDNSNNLSLLLRCTDGQLTDIATTDWQFCIKLTNLEYTIVSINNNGTIKDLLAKEELSCEPQQQEILPRPQATEEEKQAYRNKKAELGISQKEQNNSPNLIAQEQSNPHELEITNPSPFYKRPLFIAGTCTALAITIAAFCYVYFFLDTFIQHQ